MQIANGKFCNAFESFRTLEIGGVVFMHRYNTSIPIDAY